MEARWSCGAAVKAAVFLISQAPLGWRDRINSPVVFTNPHSGQDLKLGGPASLNTTQANKHI